MDLSSYPWWGYLEEDQKDGLITSYALLEREGKHPISGVHDYSFIVFPAAKAFEGFLKKLFLDLGFITEQEYKGDRFRIGRALNPNLEQHLRHESVYDKLAAFCQGEAFPNALWHTWKSSRNRLFHWWPQHQNFIDLEEAQDRITMIVDSIGKAFSECKLR